MSDGRASRDGLRVVVSHFASRAKRAPELSLLQTPSPRLSDLPWQTCGRVSLASFVGAPPWLIFTAKDVSAHWSDLVQCGDASACVVVLVSTRLSCDVIREVGKHNAWWRYSRRELQKLRAVLG